MQLRTTSLWCIGGVGSAIAVGWVAAKIHASGHAPIGLVSLGVGALLGVAVLRLAAMLRIAGAGRLITSAAVFAIVTIVAEHTWLYLDFRGQWREAREKSATVAMFRPETPLGAREYFAHEWNAALWVGDAAMIVGSAVVVVIVGARGGRFGLAADAKGAGANEIGRRAEVDGSNSDISNSLTPDP